MRLGRGVADARELQNFANQRVAVKAVVGSHGAYLNLAGVMPPGEVVRDARIEVAVDVEDVALAVLPGLDDGLVGGQGLANAEAGGAVAVPPDDQCPVADSCSCPFNLLYTIYLDCTLAPGCKG